MSAILRNQDEWYRQKMKNDKYFKEEQEKYKKDFINLGQKYKKLNTFIKIIEQDRNEFYIKIDEYRKSLNFNEEELQKKTDDFFETESARIKNYKEEFENMD